MEVKLSSYTGETIAKITGSDGKPGGSGLHPKLKLQLEWLHYTKGKFRQVTTRKGGDTCVDECGVVVT